jgi:hypothetical protein
MRLQGAKKGNRPLSLSMRAKNQSADIGLELKIFSRNRLSQVLESKSNIGVGNRIAFWVSANLEKCLSQLFAWSSSDSGHILRHWRHLQGA